ncbi:MAG: alcohol dehydrogenase catalytic domain-containing protein [Steroidobacteraceae bacterium]
MPLSDGAGEIIAIGAGVTRVRVGDRVAAIFFQRAGSAAGRQRNAAASALGAGLDGMLAQYVTLDAEGVVPLPAHLPTRRARRCPAQR